MLAGLPEEKDNPEVVRQLLEHIVTLKLVRSWRREGTRRGEGNEGGVWREGGEVKGGVCDGRQGGERRIRLKSGGGGGVLAMHSTR